MTKRCCLGCCPPRPTSQPPLPDPNSQSSSQPPPGSHSQVQNVDYKQQFATIKDATELDPLIDHIEQLLSRIKKQQHSGQTTKPESSKAREFVGGASKLLERISKEGEELQKSNLASKLPEEMQNAACRALEGLGKLHWIAAGLSIIAFALEKIQQVSSNLEKCVKLLDTMFGLAKRLKEEHRRMPKEFGNINKMVLAVVEGVITCCSCMREAKLFKYLFASTNSENLQRIESGIAKMHGELDLMISMDVQERATDIQEQMPRRYYVSEYKAPVDAVGIEDRVKEVIRSLNVGGKEHRRAVVLYGFGGVGKTTLADCVMSKLDFGGLKPSRIQLDDKQSDMKSYQEELWADLTKERIQFKDSFEGRQKLQEVLQKESSFIFIDNVLRNGQIDDLLPSGLALSSKSRILLTTRDSGVMVELQDRKIDCIKYRVDVLPSDAAKEVFREIVVRCKPGILEIISSDKIDAVAEQCHGVPLLLRVYARYLAAHPRPQICDEMLDTLLNGDFSYADVQLEQKLLYVYHQLRPDDQDAFIDVCTYFHGWSKDDVCCILRERELNALVDGSLVNIDSYNNVVVHDVLRAMGIKEGQYSRVRGLKCLAELKEVKGMGLLDAPRNKVLKIEWQHLTAIRVLAVRGPIRLLTGQRGVSLPNLRYLWIRDPAEEFPMLEGMDVLQVATLIYYGQDSRSLQGLCKSVTNMPNIQMLSLNFQTMKKFPDEFRLVGHSLRVLDLKGCRNLVELPREFGTLTALTTLNLSLCQSLAKLPDGFGNLKSLQYLHLGCLNLKTLPDDFDGLTKLRYLDLRSCTELDGNTMETLTKLENLQKLRIAGSEQLQLKWKEMPKENVRFEVEET